MSARTSLTAAVVAAPPVGPVPGVVDLACGRVVAALRGWIMARTAAREAR